MKSRLFSRFDPEEKDNKSLQRDLSVFLSLTDGQKASFVGALAEVTLNLTPEEDKVVFERLEAETGCSRITIGRMLNVLQFFLLRMQERETRDDSAEQWGEDLATLGLLSDSESRVLVHSLEQVRSEVLPKVESDVKRRRYSTGVLPSLKSLGMTVELRAVQEERYHWGSPLKEYRPRIVDTVGVVSIHIGVDEGLQRDFYFQVNERELQAMLDSLVAAQKDLEALQRSLSFITPARD